MDYDLAKELKDAGFLQGDRIGGTAFRTSGPPLEADDFAYEPTLEELIEACGENFDALFSNFERIEKGYRQPHQWRADTTNRTGYSCAGATPVEAIARLWLALNRKKQ